jgi:hypothetical protein
MTHRWIRYEAPIMVCVAIDAQGERVVNVVLAEDAEDIRLARSHDGQPLVYDERMELLNPNDATAQAALREAEDRDWPGPAEWDGGPDPLRYPGLYEAVDEEDDDLGRGPLNQLGLDEDEPAGRAR